MRAVKNRGRMLVAAGVTLLVRTKVRQWQRVAAAGTPPWDERNKTIVEFIPAGIIEGPPSLNPATKYDFHLTAKPIPPRVAVPTGPRSGC